MDATDITNVIARHRHMRLPIASGIRRAGLRLIDREGNRLRQVQLLKSPA